MYILFNLNIISVSLEYIYIQSFAPVFLVFKTSSIPCYDMFKTFIFVVCFDNKKQLSFAQSARYYHHQQQQSCVLSFSASHLQTSTCLLILIFCLNFSSTSSVSTAEDWSRAKLNILAEENPKS